MVLKIGQFLYIEPVFSFGKIKGQNANKQKIKTLNMVFLSFVQFCVWHCHNALVLWLSHCARIAVVHLVLPIFVGVIVCVPFMIDIYHRTLQCWMFIKNLRQFSNYHYFLFSTYFTFTSMNAFMLAFMCKWMWKFKNLERVARTFQCWDWCLTYLL